MKLCKLFLSFSIAFVLLTGCASMDNDASMLMPPIKYKKPIDVRSKQKAYLHWQSGVVYTGTTIAPTYTGQYALLDAMINSLAQGDQPNWTRYQYGKSRQAVFMSSLKNVLFQNSVFKDIDYSADAIGSKPGIDITVNFKETRVGYEEDAFPITINARLSIQQKGHKAFVKNYSVQSQFSHSLMNRPTFKDQQINVSKALMQKVIGGIEMYLKQTRS